MVNLSSTKQERMSNGKKDSLFNKWCWENCTATCRIMKLDHFLTPHTKIDLKMDERPQCEKGIPQNPWGEHRKQPLQLQSQQLLPRNIAKGKGSKEKNELLDFIKTKIFCTAKETVHKTKRQLTEWEKIFANALSDKGLVSKIYKELSKLNTQRPNNPIKKWEEDMNRCFCKEDIQMANRHMKKCSTSLGIREIQIKTTMRYHLTPVRMAKFNKSGNERCWRGCGERGTLLHCWWDPSWYSHSGKQHRGSLKS